MTKTDFLWCAYSRRQYQILDEPLMVGSDLVQPVRLFEIWVSYLDSDLSMNTHNTRPVFCCFSVLRQIRSFSRSVSQPITHFYVLYCHLVLFCSFTCFSLCVLVYIGFMNCGLAVFLLYATLILFVFTLHKMTYFRIPFPIVCILLNPTPNSLVC